MFRVAPKKKDIPAEMLEDGPKPQAKEEAPEVVIPEPTPEEEPLADLAAGPSGKVDQVMVLYMGPEFGPFRCDNCRHYQEPGQCDIVDGEIDPGAKCNLFEPKSGGPQDDLADTPIPEEGLEPSAPEGAI